MWQKNFYTGEELERMKSDAERRVREMRERTQKISSENSGENRKGNSEKRQVTALKENVKNQSVRVNSNGALQTIQGLLKNLAIDEEKLVVVLLILILMREKADSKLILALVWILI